MPSCELRSATMDAFLDRLASSAPTPGGGSVAGLLAALAAALARMVCAFTRGRPRFAAVEHDVAACDTELARLDSVARDLMEDDAAAYAQLQTAFKLARTEPSRPARLAEAAELAALVPLAVATTARQVGTVLDRLEPIGNPQLLPDVHVARELVRAAIRAAAINVRVNLPYVSEPGAARLRAELAHLEDAAPCEAGRGPP